jgi:hypothetical protein
MSLPVSQLTLFQHGLGSFVRSGSAEADFVISVPRSAMDDVLKSLTIMADGGVTVQSVAFETPSDRNPNARRRSLELDPNAALTTLVGGVIGSRVEVIVGDRRIVGELLGLERESEDHLKRAVVMVNTGDGVEIVAVSTVQRIVLLDQASANDLSFGLEERRRDTDRAEARVQLSAAAEVTVAYTAPAPAWRVSYRVLVGAASAAAQPNANGESNPDQRDVVIQGWGLFDNTLDEDLDGVDLTLTAGMPVSFRYELHEPNTPERPVVRDDRRVLAEAFEFAPMAASADVAFESEAVLRKSRAPAPAGASPRSRRMEAAQLMESAPAQASGESQGALFAYHISAPVSVRRGESGMVPIVTEQTKGSRELLYNPRKTPSHPAVSVRLRNGSNVLERGPATVFEAGAYAGEAVLSFTTPGSEIVIGYAMELGIRVTPTTNQRSETRGIVVRDGSLVYSMVDVFSAMYVVESQLDGPVSVVVEHPRTYDTALVTDAAESSSTEARYRVAVAARSTETVIVVEQRGRLQYEHISGLDGLRLQGFLNGDLLDQQTFDRLSQVVELHARISSIASRMAERESERATVRSRLEDVRSNLSLLDTARDSALRDRFVRQLEEFETKMIAFDDADETDRVAIATVNQQITASLLRLESDSDS